MAAAGGGLGIWGLRGRDRAASPWSDTFRRAREPGFSPPGLPIARPVRWRRRDDDILAHAFPWRGRWGRSIRASIRTLRRTRPNGAGGERGSAFPARSVGVGHEGPAGGASVHLYVICYLLKNLRDCQCHLRSDAGRSARCATRLSAGPHPGNRAFPLSKITSDVRRSMARPHPTEGRTSWRQQARPAHLT